MTTSRPPGHDIPREELELANTVFEASRQVGALTEELDTTASLNERFALLILRQAELRRTLFDASLPLIAYWRTHETTPDFEVARERLLAAADAVEDLDALQRWIDTDITACRRMRQQMLDDPRLVETETFRTMIQSQIDDGATPFAPLRAAALGVGARVSGLAAEQQQWAMRRGAEQQGIAYTEQVHDDGSRVITFDVGRQQRAPWWRRLLRRGRS